MQCAAFHLFPFRLTSADCVVPNNADPIRSSAHLVLLVTAYFMEGRGQEPSHLNWQRTLLVNLFRAGG
jgi:hypothetical protein